MKISLIGPLLFCFAISTTWGHPDFQLGSEWGPRPYRSEMAAGASPELARAARSTARLTGGTSFYLGLVKGQHLMATNHHLMPSSASCEGRSIIFPELRVEAVCEQIVGTWAPLDLTLFTLKISPADAAGLRSAGLVLQRPGTVRAGQALFTVGFGIAHNPLQQLVANQDDDCKLLSAPDDIRLLGDADRFHPNEQRVWSVAIGCDASYGDSGSPVLNRQSGEVLGILWTAKVPKVSRFQKSETVEKIFQENSDEIWSELTYAVPAVKIRAVLEGELQRGRLPSHSMALLRAWLAK